MNSKFLEKAKDYIGKDVCDLRVGNFYCTSLHEFNPQDPDLKYDLIWVQWVTGHLTDQDFVQFLKRCKSILNQPHGLIIIKVTLIQCLFSNPIKFKSFNFFLQDNHTSCDESDADTLDSSVTRPYWLFLEIFKKAGLELVSERRQYKFPKGLYPVKLFALK